MRPVKGSLLQQAAPGRGLVAWLCFALASSGTASAQEHEENEPEASRAESDAGDETPETEAEAETKPSKGSDAMEEIIVTGTAIGARRKEIGNSVGVLRMDQLEKQPIANMEEALSGGVEGVNVLNASGAPGTGNQVRIRGVNSITQGNDPLIYVDGVRVYSGAYRGFKSGGIVTAASSNQQSSVLNDINPNDIERIEVIKGAAATTLYGTEASSGVIQIFTKGGKTHLRDFTRWDMTVTGGVTRLRTLWGPQEPSQAWWDTYGTESQGLWLDQWKRTGTYQQYNLSVLGQTGDIGYNISGKWQNETGVLPEEGAQDWSLRGNLRFRPLKDLTVQYNNFLVRRRIEWLPNGNEAEGFLVNVLRGPKGYTGKENAADAYVLEQDFEDTHTHWVSGLTVAYAPLPGLNTTLTLGFDLLDQEALGVTPFGSFFVPMGERSTREWQSETRTLDFRTTYRANVTPDITSTSAFGFSAFDERQHEVSALSQNLAGGAANSTLNSGSQRQVEESRQREVNAGFFVQQAGGFYDQLFVTAGLRVDGNSSFGRSYGLQPYPKLSAAYVISQHAFWPQFFDFTKLRGAVGWSGKAPGRFDAAKVWSPIKAKATDVGVIPSNLGNPELGPERTREIEAGVETSMGGGRATLDVNVYQQRTSGALIRVALDPSLGFSGSQLRNIGLLDNSGLELNLRATPVQTPLLEWEVGLKLSLNKSNVISLGGEEDIYLGNDMSAVPGYPVAAYHADVILNPNEVGTPMIERDDTYIGPVFPTNTWQFDTTIRITGGLSITGRGELVRGHYLQSNVSYLNARREVWPACFDIQQRIKTDEPVTAGDRWLCDRSHTKNDAHIFPADFFRLRYVAVNYSLPDTWLPDWMDAATVSLAGRNLWLLTGYRGLDPESRETSNGGGGLNRHEYYNTPPVTRVNLTLRATM